jgi:16S rRNA (uracil1498-N3)-methyltransferase
MRLHRFYVEQPLGEEVVINDVSLIKQWSKVFRYTETDFVTLFNGDGNDITYSIQDINSKESKLLRTKLSPSYIPTKNITLYLSLIKKDNFELVVQKATELGVTKIVPIISERSEKKNLNEDRLHKITIEASEQCGRGDIPVIHQIIKLSDAINLKRENECVLLMQMGGISINDVICKETYTSNDISVFIGPEGGWSEQEETIFRDNGAIAISLGKTVLRAETAAIAAISILQL